MQKHSILQRLGQRFNLLPADLAVISRNPLQTELELTQSLYDLWATELKTLANSQVLRKLATKEWRAGTKITDPDITRERFKTKLEQLLLVW